MTDAVREALLAIQQRANESGTGEMGLINTIHAMHKIAGDALAALPAAKAAGDVRCLGCGSAWTSEDLASAKADDPKIISCCPERKALDITGWMARAIALEAELRRLKYGTDAASSLPRPQHSTPVSGGASK